MWIVRTIGIRRPFVLRRRLKHRDPAGLETVGVDHVDAAQRSELPHRLVIGAGENDDADPDDLGGFAQVVEHPRRSGVGHRPALIGEDRAERMTAAIPPVDGLSSSRRC